MKNNSKRRRVLSLALVGAMFAGLLAGCGSKKGGANLSEYVYVPSYTELPKDVVDISSPVLVGDTIYFASTTYVHKDGTPATQAELDSIHGPSSTDSPAESPSPEQPAVDLSDLVNQPSLCSVKKDGTGYAKLADYQPKQKAEGNYSYTGINSVAADEQGNLWISENFSKTIYNFPANFDSMKDDPSPYYQSDEQHTYIRKLSNTGKELACTELADIAGTDGQNEKTGDRGGSSINGMAAGKDGSVYLIDMGTNELYVLGQDGKLACKLPADNDSYIGALVKLKDGSVGVTVSGKDGKAQIKLVNTAAKTWGQKYDVSINVWNTLSGGKQYDFCYNDGTSLCGYDLASNKNENILSWINSDVSSNDIRFAQMQDNGDVFVIAGKDKGNGCDIITLKKTARKDVKQKTTLTLATMYLDYGLRGEILAFNKASEDTRIEVKDYSEFNTDTDSNAGITKLSTEMVSGNIPDLIDVSQLPYRQYAAKGLLEDIYPYLDKDTEYKRDAFVPSVIKAAEQGGKLYALPSGFSIVSICGNPDKLGSEMGWTMAEMQDIIKQHPEADKPFGGYMARKDILDSLVMLNMGSYIDWNTGKCTFDSDGFKGLLNFAKSFPEKIDTNSPEASDGNDTITLVQDGRQIMQFSGIYDFDSYAQEKAQFGGKLVFKGMPSEDKKGNVAMLSGGIAMTTSCKNKDVAWQFMRRLLSEEYQKNNNWYLPIVQKIYDQRLADAMKQEYRTDENGKQVPISRGGFSTGNGQMVEIYALTQEDADAINTVVKSVTRTVSIDQKITNMIDEEAATFFSGEKDVNKAAEIIQSRMNVYVNEQK